MNDASYTYPAAQCEVLDQEALQRFREKRAVWLDWLNGDEHHPIFSVISSMVWTDVAFRTLAKAGELEPTGALSNPLVAEALINGHFATQALAIRRLLDGRKDVISLVRLLRDIGENIDLFTRENFVAFDGLPYDNEVSERRVMSERIGVKGPFWGERTGPDAYGASEIAHRAFDRLSGTAPSNRSRKDVIAKSYIEGLQGWIEASGAADIVVWTHKFLAHAADRRSRTLVDEAAIEPNLDKITGITRVFVRTSEAVNALFLSGHGEVMPVAQFNQFENLDKPVLGQAHEAAIDAHWDKLSHERDGFRLGALDDLLGQAVSDPTVDAPGPSLWDVMRDPEWLSDPDGKFDREVERCLEEFRGKN